MARSAGVSRVSRWLGWVYAVFGGLTLVGAVGGAIALVMTAIGAGRPFRFVGPAVLFMVPVTLLQAAWGSLALVAGLHLSRGRPWARPVLVALTWAVLLYVGCFAVFVLVLAGRGQSGPLEGTVFLVIAGFWTALAVCGLVLLRRQESRPVPVPEPPEQEGPVKPPAGPEGKSSEEDRRGLWLAVASLAFTCLSMVVGPLGFIPGIILGHVYLSKYGHSGSRAARGMAIAGVVAGWFFCITFILVVVVLFVVLPRHADEAARFLQWRDGVASGLFGNCHGANSMESHWT